MQISEHSNDELATTAAGCNALANQFDKGGSVATTLNAAATAIRELIFYRRLAEQPGGGTKIYVTAPGDLAGKVRDGEPMPRPYVVAIMPYAKWLVLESSAQRVPELEFKFAAMTESSERNAKLADNFEKMIVALQAKNAPATT